MLNGSLMQYYVGAVEEPTARAVYVWWEEGQGVGKLGTIYFVDDAEGKREKTKIDTQSLPLSKISDVFSGKQSPIFKAPSLAGLPSDQCFTLVSKIVPLNLQAESNAVRGAWIKGIKETFAVGQAAKKAAAAAPAPSPTAAAPNAVAVAFDAAPTAATTATTATTVPASATTAPAAAASTTAASATVRGPER